MLLCYQMNTKTIIDPFFLRPWLLKLITFSYFNGSNKRQWTNLQFGIGEFPFATMRIIHHVVTFNGDSNQSECRASTSSPCEASTSYQTA